MAGVDVTFTADDDTAEVLAEGSGEEEVMGEGSGEEGSGEGEEEVHRSPPKDVNCKRRYTQMWQCYADHVTEQSTYWANVSISSAMNCLSRQCPLAISGDRSSGKRSPIVASLNNPRMPKGILLKHGERCAKEISSEVRARTVACVNKKFDWFDMPQIFAEGNLELNMLRMVDFVSAVSNDCYLSKLCPINAAKAKIMQGEMCQQKNKCFQGAADDCTINEGEEVRRTICACVGRKSDRLKREAVVLLAECINRVQSDVIVTEQKIGRLNKLHELVNTAGCADNNPFLSVSPCHPAPNTQHSQPRFNVDRNSLENFIGASSGVRQLAVKGAQEFTDTSNWKSLWEAMAGRRPYSPLLSSPIADTLNTASRIMTGTQPSQGLNVFSPNNLPGLGQLGQNLASLLQGGGQQIAPQIFASPVISEGGIAQSPSSALARGVDRLSGVQGRQSIIDMQRRQFAAQQKADDQWRRTTTRPRSIFRNPPPTPDPRITTEELVDYFESSVGGG